MQGTLILDIKSTDMKDEVLMSYQIAIIHL